MENTSCPHAGYASLHDAGCHVALFPFKVVFLEPGYHHLLFFCWNFFWTNRHFLFRNILNIKDTSLFIPFSIIYTRSNRRRYICKEEPFWILQVSGVVLLDSVREQAWAGEVLITCCWDYTLEMYRRSRLKVLDSTTRLGSASDAWTIECIWSVNVVIEVGLLDCPFKHDIKSH